MDVVGVQPNSVWNKSQPFLFVEGPQVAVVTEKPLFESDMEIAEAPSGTCFPSLATFRWFLLRSDDSSHLVRRTREASRLSGWMKGEGNVKRHRRILGFDRRKRGDIRFVTLLLI